MGVPLYFPVARYGHAPPALHDADQRWGYQEKADKQRGIRAHSTPSPQLSSPTAQVDMHMASIPAEKELSQSHPTYL